MSDQLAILKTKGEQAKEYITATDIPLEIEALLISDLIFKADKRSNEGCYITLQVGKNKGEIKYIAQKYTSTQYVPLHDAIIACGSIDKLKADFHIWKKERIGRAINERLFPQPKPKPTK